MDCPTRLQLALHELKVFDTKQRASEPLVAAQPMVDRGLGRVLHARHRDVRRKAAQFAGPARRQQSVVNLLAELKKQGVAITNSHRQDLRRTARLLHVNVRLRKLTALPWSTRLCYYIFDCNLV